MRRQMMNSGDGRIQLCIAGDWTDGGSDTGFQVLDPAAGSVRATFQGASPEDVDRAAASAIVGFEAWSTTPAWSRGMVLLQVGDILRARRARIAVGITAEQGKPLEESLAEVARAADFFTWAGGAAPRLHGRWIPSRDGSEIVADVAPIGPVCAMTPWNYPLILLAKKLSAALAAGCSVVLKPSEETPGAAIELVEACQDAGIPPDVLNLVIGDPAMISRRLIAHPGIRKVSFTGSIEVGRLLAGQAGQALKPITLELGGHAPVIVCDDIDVAVTAKLLVERKFHNAGQACIAPSRFFVHERVFDDFLEAFAEAAKGLRIGSGSTPGVQMGPLANARRLAAMEEIVEDSLRHGGDIVTGGRRLPGDGFFFSPTVIRRPGAQSKAMTQEPFGPVAAIVPFATLDEAIQQANALPYGLAAYGFTNEPGRQARLAAALQAGLVGVNTLPGHLPEYPLGGWKDSGMGVEGGAEAIDSYLIRRLVSRRPSAA